MKGIGKILLGSLLGIVLGVICCFMNTTNKNSYIQPKYYDNCNFDFIIPKPWYTQIPEIKKMDIIEDITPYYVTGRNISYNGKNLSVDMFLFEENANINITSFGKNLIKEGISSLSSNEIILDEKTATSLSLKVGDKVTVVFGANSIQYSISGIVLQNRFSTRPTAAIIYTGKVKSEIESNIEHLSYSAAFVSANNISEAEVYFNSKYAAMGKVGERSWYESDDSYEYMKNSIQKTSAAKEVTNISQLKANTTSEYKETNRKDVQNVVIATILIILLTLLVWILNISLSSKQFRNDIKLGAKVKSVINKFIIGELCEVIVFSVILILFKNQFSTIQLSLYLSFGIISFVLIQSITRNNINKVKENIKKEIHNEKGSSNNK